MTIAQAFNEIAVTHGGTASTSGTIAGAIDALNDALAGSDQPAACTIEAAVRLLGEHIGGGGSQYGIWVSWEYAEAYESAAIQGAASAEQHEQGIYNLDVEDFTGTSAILPIGMYVSLWLGGGNYTGNGFTLSYPDGTETQFTDYVAEYDSDGGGTLFSFVVPDAPYDTETSTASTLWLNGLD